MGIENRATDKYLQAFVLLQSWCLVALGLVLLVLLSGFCRRGVLVLQKNSKTLLGVLVLQKNSKTLLHIFLEEEPGPCPKATILFLDCFSLVPASPPFPD